MRVAHSHAAESDARKLLEVGCVRTLEGRFDWGRVMHTIIWVEIRQKSESGCILHKGRHQLTRAVKSLNSVRSVGFRVGAHGIMLDRTYGITHVLFIP